MSKNGGINHSDVFVAKEWISIHLFNTYLLVVISPSCLYTLLKRLKLSLQNGKKIKWDL